MTDLERPDGMKPAVWNVISHPPIPRSTPSSGGSSSGPAACYAGSGYTSLHHPSLCPEEGNPMTEITRSADPHADLIRAWLDDQGRPARHRTRQEIVRREMPLLADALDRLTRDDRGRR